MNDGGEIWAQIFRRGENIVARDIAGERLLVPVKGELADMQRLFTLNPVGACIWDNLDGRKDLAGVRDAVLERFDVSREEAERDIGEFVGRILEAGLIEEAR